MTVMANWLSRKQQFPSRLAFFSVAAHDARMGERKPRSDEQRQRRREMRRPIEPLYIAVGERIREARQRRGMMQKDLAAAVGYKRSTLHYIEVGRDRIPLHSLVAIADLLGVEVTDLLPRRHERG